MSESDFFALKVYGGLAIGVVLFLVIMVKSSWRVRRDIAFLTFPFWGTVLTVMIGCVTKFDGVIYIGGFLAILSAHPIIEFENIGIAAKILLILAYYALSLLVIFVVGWAASCYCHSC